MVHTTIIKNEEALIVLLWNGLQGIKSKVQSNMKKMQLFG